MRTKAVVWSWEREIGQRDAGLGGSGFPYAVQPSLIGLIPSLDTLSTPTPSRRLINAISTPVVSQRETSVIHRTCALEDEQMTQVVAPSAWIQALRHCCYRSVCTQHMQSIHQGELGEVFKTYFRWHLNSPLHHTSMPWRVPPIFLRPTRWSVRARSESPPEVEDTGISLASLRNEVCFLFLLITHGPRVILSSDQY